MSKQTPATVLLTDEQIEYLDERAKVVALRYGVHASRSAVVRKLIDQARGQGRDGDGE